jgi:RNA-directed DNA polymerase
VGTPQGGPLSPVLANLFLHYALDHWLATHHPSVPFCRYADDGILHCRSESEANQMREHVAERLRDCRLELHPDKTRVVYCKDSNRIGSYEHVQFDFLGYTFRPRFAQSRVGARFTAFTPALSRSSATAIRQTVRQWRLNLRSDASLEELATRYSPAIRGWIGYYCRFHRSAFGVVSKHIDAALVRWAMRKYKRLRGHKKRATTWLAAKRQQDPYIFPHWCPPKVLKVGAMGAR